MGTKHTFVEVKTVLDEKRVDDFVRVDNIITITTIFRIVTADAEVTRARALGGEEKFAAAARIAEDEIFRVTTTRAAINIFATVNRVAF